VVGLDQSVASDVLRRLGSTPSLQDQGRLSRCVGCTGGWGEVASNGILGMVWNIRDQVRDWHEFHVLCTNVVGDCSPILGFSDADGMKVAGVANPL